MSKEPERDFANLVFQVECSQIKLSLIGDSNYVIKGPGEIWQDQDGVIQFKLFALENSHSVAWRDYSVGIGEIIPDSDYFRLEAIDIRGRSWRACYIDPSLRGTVVYGKINQLTHEFTNSSSPKQDCIGLYLKGLLKFPSNSPTESSFQAFGREIHYSVSHNAALVNYENYKLEIFHREKHTILNFYSPLNTLDENTSLRIKETLQFCLGLPVSILVSRIYKNKSQVFYFNSPSQVEQYGRIEPPILFEKGDQNEQFWKLFFNYFCFVCSYTENSFHPISQQIASTIESSAGSLEVEVLGLAVATEGIVEICFPNLGEVSEEIKQQITDVLKVIDSSNIITNSSLHNRIKGALNNMNQPTNSDRIRNYLSEHNLSKELFTAWKKLRNTSAHGNGTAGRNISQTLELRGKVLFLLYSIILTKIEYVGERTDYSTKNRPTISWP